MRNTGSTTSKIICQVPGRRKMCRKSIKMKNELITLWTQTEDTEW